jgi:3-methyladenine DNA glycosylase AlkD
MGTEGASGVAALRARARARVRGLRAQSDRDVLDEALSVYGAGDVFLAYEILRAAPRAIAAATKKDVERLGRGMDSWGSVDCFASFVSGVAWRLGRIDDAAVARWTTSKDRWWRRAALVSTVPLNNRARGATATGGDAARTLAMCARLVDDRDDMVVKAMSWALRELGKHDAKAVKSFVTKHHDALAPRVLREVAAKLTTGLKNPGKARAPAKIVAKPRRR